MNSSRQSNEARQAEQRLLEQGAESYVDAVTALVEYRRVVARKCKDLFLKHLADCSDALGLTVKVDNVTDCAGPRLDKLEAWTGIDAFLGATISGVSGPAGISWWSLSCYLFWDYSDAAKPYFGVVVDMGLPARLAGNLFTRLKEAGVTDVQRDGEVVWVHQQCDTRQAPEFEESLEPLLKKWIKGLKKIGGLKSIVAVSGGTADDDE